MLIVHQAKSRGETTTNWLNSFHSFSFGDYYDPQNKGISSLRVINEDYIKAGAGFDQHPHFNMEIFTFMISGELQHKDTMGNITKIKAGEVQLMSTGTGVEHSEHNPSKTKDCHLLQIWIKPKIKNTQPKYYQKAVSSFPVINKNQQILFSETEENESLPILQDAKVSLYNFDELTNFNIKIDPSRNYWIQSLSELEINGTKIENSDGIKIASENILECTGPKGARFLFFDLN